jgi:Ca2+/Na+ antiporter
LRIEGALNRAFIDVLLLGAVVSLPEMATTIAATLGEAGLAVNTLPGGIAATIVILAVTDALTGHEPLSTDPFLDRDSSSPVPVKRSLFKQDSEPASWACSLAASQRRCPK